MNSVVYYISKIIKKAHLKAIHKSFIDPSSKIEAGSEFNYSSMGKYSFCGYNCEINYCEIGSYCSIANQVIIGGSMHPVQWVSTSPVFYDNVDSIKKKFSFHAREKVQKTIIGHDVWIGSRAIIKQGVIIGTGAIIGMGSIVTKDVNPYEIVGGAPARLIRKRFSEDYISKLLKDEWWNKTDKEIESIAKYFNNIDAYIELLNQMEINNS